MKVAREMLEEDVRDLEEEREELQTFVELNSELNKKNENLEKEYKCKENDLKELSNAMVCFKLSSLLNSPLSSFAI
jgi:predicted nuclease with TOPRIM domain